MDKKKNETEKKYNSDWTNDRQRKLEEKRARDQYHREIEEAAREALRERLMKKEQE